VLPLFHCSLTVAVWLQFLRTLVSLPLFETGDEAGKVNIIGFFWSINSQFQYTLRAFANNFTIVILSCTS